MNNTRQCNYDDVVEYIKTHQSELYRLAYRFTRNEDATLDILQDAIFVSLEKIGKMKDTPPETHVLGALVKECDSYIRRHGHPRPDGEGTATERTIDSMPPVDKTPIILRLYGDYSSEQIAMILSIPQNVAEKRTMAAMKRFESRLPSSLWQTRAVPLPEQFDMAVNKALSFPSSFKKKQPVWMILFFITLALLAHILCLNLIRGYADFASSLPLIGKVNEKLTFSSFSDRLSGSILDVHVRPVDPDVGTSAEKKAKQALSDKLNETVGEVEIRAREHYRVYLEEGGNAAEYRALNVDIDYSIEYQDEEYVSFVITQREKAVYFYESAICYTLSLSDGRLMSLGDLVGEDYAEKLLPEVRLRLEKTGEPIRNDIDLSSLLNDQRRFYVDREGRLVVLFEGYELSSELSGIRSVTLTENVLPKK